MTIFSPPITRCRWQHPDFFLYSTVVGTAARRFLVGSIQPTAPVARSIKWLKIQLKINMDMDQTVNHIKVTRIPQKKNTTKWWKVFLWSKSQKFSLTPALALVRGAQATWMTSFPAEAQPMLLLSTASELGQAREDWTTAIYIIEHAMICYVKTWG